MTKIKEEKGHEKEFHDESACYWLIFSNGILNGSSYKCNNCICCFKACDDHL